jgi:hypothetical protein
MLPGANFTSWNWPEEPAEIDVYANPYALCEHQPTLPQELLLGHGDYVGPYNPVDPSHVVHHGAAEFAPMDPDWAVALESVPSFDWNAVANPSLIPAADGLDLPYDVSPEQLFFTPPHHPLHAVSGLADAMFIPTRFSDSHMPIPSPPLVPSASRKSTGSRGSKTKRRPSMHLDLSDINHVDSTLASMAPTPSSAGSKRLRATPIERTTPITASDLFPIAMNVNVVDTRTRQCCASLDLSWISPLNALTSSAPSPLVTYLLFPCILTPGPRSVVS